MKALRIASSIIAAATFLASILVGRDWLASGGGDPASLAMWTATCLVAGFCASTALPANEEIARLERQLESKRAEVADRDATIAALHAEMGARASGKVDELTEAVSSMQSAPSLERRASGNWTLRIPK